SCPRPYLHLGWPLEYAGDSKPVARSFRGTVYAPRFNCPVAWRCLMRHVSLHPSSFALPPGLRLRSNGHTLMPGQNRLRPSQSSANWQIWTLCGIKNGLDRTSTICASASFACRNAAAKFIWPIFKFELLNLEIQRLRRPVGRGELVGRVGIKER